MTPKKKSSVAANAGVETEAVKGSQAARKGPKASATGSAGGGNSAVAAQEPPRPGEIQLTVWNQAVQLFSKRRFEEALPLFQEAARGPAVHVADKARSYEQICQRHCSRPEVEFRTAEDHFYFGVERLNAGDLYQAKTHLSQALKLQPEGDHIFYTMALCCGFAGDGNGACENLKRAIDLEPRNRVMAKQDSEFGVLAQQFPALRALLSPEPASGS